MLCLESLELAIQNIDVEIIVVDNASGDNTKTLVSQNFPQVKYIQSETNDGFSIANNKGITVAKGEYIFLINPDTVISESAIKNAMLKHKSLPNCGILGVQLVDGTGHFLPESKINQLTLKVAVFKFLGLPKSFYNHNIHEDDEGETATLVGAFMCFKKKDYHLVEGLDDNYFMYGEDIDLSYQFVKKGFKNYYFGKEQILHFKGESTLKDTAYFNRFFASVKYYFQKHYTNSKWIVSLLSLFFVIAKWTKKSDMVKKHRIASDFNQIVCVTNNDDLIHKLTKHFQTEVLRHNPSTFQKTSLQNDYIIFDKNCLTFKEIIQMMKKNATQENYFRIKPSNFDVLLGSDSSTSQGEIILL
jgi:GT2 family glycosyltransferase